MPVGRGREEGKREKSTKMKNDKKKVQRWERKRKEYKK